MQILSVTLKNFKTHKDKHFEFELGTNAICGENGAGKTSILEAIAWVLFNHSGGYTKEDLIRNGASSAQVRVAFISSRDNRTYEAQRSTSQGYTLYDPQLAERLPYTRTKDEVLPWLRQHIGVAPGTDLSQLFANTIGVPQGTFTVDFLLPKEKRKPIFDTVLKVEEYRETYKQSNSLRKYSEAQSQRLKDLIEQYEESLQSWDDLQAGHQKLRSEIQIGENQLAELEKLSEKLTKQRQEMKAQAEQIQILKAQQQQIDSQVEVQQHTQQQSERSLVAAREAETICKTQKSAYEAFLTVETQIEQLSKKSQERQQLSRQQQQSQQALAKDQSDLLRLETRLEQFEHAEEELVGLAKEVAAQVSLEGRKAGLEQQSQSFSNFRFQQQSLVQQAKRLERELAQVEADLARLVALKKASAQIPQWEEQQSRIRVQMSRIAAARQFEQELSKLAEKGQAEQDDYRQQVAAALQTMEQWVGRFEALDGAAIAPIKKTLFQGGLLSKATLKTLNGILADLATQTDKAKLEQQQREIQAQLQRAYAQKGELAGIETQQAKREQLAQHQVKAKQDLENLSQKLESEQSVTKLLSQINSEIEALGNPKGKQQLLQKSLEQKMTVSAQYQALQSAQKTQVEQVAAIAQKLQVFESLDDQQQVQQQAKQLHQAGYLQYLQNQQSAQQVEPLAAKVQSIAAAMAQLVDQKRAIAHQLADHLDVFDPKAFTLLETRLSEANSQADRLRGSLPQQQARLVELDGRLAELKATAQKRDQAQEDLKQRDRIKRFVNYARRVYKEAGPRITERYVHNISREADRLFRELLGRSNVALTWSADYEISVQEGSHNRRFMNLSGGEQMCAALAVRLALLKILADVDVAFFDEPTTNMDRPRRASLAEAIARIKSFKQLFVISHDDTFEQVTETVISVTRDND
ncbi:MAG: SMC family ATPase [Leptolyngbya foveolarum]|uniref:Nuclease SbcCD subunit C n=1 Tax=Leptolyngbya foveolarum TaxID=47253 RepID=A0A2W4TSA5_9CYAN|nr:MAG: SMC family ATPase [Leptolyngbya foveolarum]